MVQERLSVLALFGTRPEVIKLAPVIHALGRDERFRVRVVSTSQHREMIAGLLELFAIRPDHDLQVIQPNQTLTDISTRTLAGLEPLLRKERPDLLLTQGDTTSAFAGALAAFYQRVEVAHVEAGLRSHDKRHPFPEEINRRLISAVCDLHFAPTASAERNLLGEGIDASNVFVTGNTVIDALRWVHGRDGNSLERHLPERDLVGRRLVLVTAHRREAFDGPLAELCHGLRELVRAYPDLLVLYPVHLNPNVQRTVLPILGDQASIRLVDPLPYEAFVQAMARAHLIITDSGGVQEEAPSLGKPVLVFRKVTERGEGVAARGAKIVGLSRERLVAEASRLLDDEAAYRDMTRHRDLYGDGQASARIVQAILHHFGRAARPARFAEPG
jgi:UDP-N-acetylglucosamine 2-epimerase (non-hydrolysing)